MQRNLPKATVSLETQHSDVQDSMNKAPLPLGIRRLLLTILSFKRFQINTNINLNINSKQ